MIPTKICGITNVSDAMVAVHHGTSAIGFIFYEQSPRGISIEKGNSISDQISNKVARVGVFVNHPKEFIDKAIQTVPLDMVQLHGDESPEFCGQFSVPVMKAIRIKNKQSFNHLDEFNVHGFLLDTFTNNQYGGTGKPFDWSLVNGNGRHSIILSGGLRANNILDAILSVNPVAVDVNSGVESSAGKKDHSKIEKLFEVLKETEQTEFNFG